MPDISETNILKSIDESVLENIPDRVLNEINSKDGEYVICAEHRGLFSAWSKGFLLTNRSILQWDKKKTKRYNFNEVSDLNLSARYDDEYKFNNGTLKFKEGSKKVEFWSPNVDFYKNVLFLLDEIKPSSQIIDLINEFEEKGKKRQKRLNLANRISGYISESKSVKNPTLFRIETQMPDVGLWTKILMKLDNSYSAEIDGKKIVYGECNYIHSYPNHIQFSIQASDIFGKAAGTAMDTLVTPGTKTTMFFWGWQDIDLIEYSHRSARGLFGVDKTEMLIKTEFSIFRFEMAGDDARNFLALVESNNVKVEASSFIPSTNEKASKTHGRKSPKRKGRYPCPKCGYQNSSTRVTCKECRINLEEAYNEQA
ncbi:MAG: hypothetical protein KC421_02450 [Anaerolineales bacterium]|nr:hypothetical protein [Anaerolineales bacterium]